MGIHDWFVGKGLRFVRGPIQQRYVPLAGCRAHTYDIVRDQEGSYRFPKETVQHVAQISHRSERFPRTRIKKMSLCVRLWKGTCFCGRVLSFFFLLSSFFFRLSSFLSFSLSLFLSFSLSLFLSSLSFSLSLFLSFSLSLFLSFSLSL